MKTLPSPDTFRAALDMFHTAANDQPVIAFAVVVVACAIAAKWLVKVVF